jgi:hypothetical protein
MPKKLSTRRHAAAQPQRPQPKKKDVVLVQTTSASRIAETAKEEAEGQSTTETPKAGETKTRPSNQSAKVVEHPTSTAGKHPTTTTKSPSQPTRALPASQRTGRPGQRSAARPGPRAVVGRQANLVSAEHYRYVLKDLRLIGILAAIMFSVIIALTFILPHVLNYSR